MVELIPSLEGVGREAVTRVIEGLEERGVTLPPLIMVEGSDGRWRTHAARVPVERRRRSVAAVTSVECALDAVRFEFGGAIRLPVSSVSLELACEAVERNPPGAIPLATPGVVEAVVAGAGCVIGVGWPLARFWRTQIGSPQLSDYLVAIATGLECVPVVVPGPTLVVADRAPVEIRTMIEDTAASGGYGYASPPSIVPLGTRLTALDIDAEAVEDETAAPADTGSRPVLDVLSGRRVGGWSLTRADRVTGPGWRALPDATSLWTLEHPDGSTEVVSEFPTTADQSVIKIPGWIGARVGPGSPSGIVVEAVAKDPVRNGQPLWISNADADAVRFLLGLPGPIWVDGPGVPAD
jgi:hypothetical protein